MHTYSCRSAPVRAVRSGSAAALLAVSLAAPLAAIVAAAFQDREAVPAAQEAGTVVGRLRNAAGRPARRHVVLCRVPPGEERELEPVVCARSSGIWTGGAVVPYVHDTYPGTDGGFRFAKVRPGTWRLAHYALGAYHFTLPFEVAAGELADTGVLQLASRSPAQWVRGRVRGATLPFDSFSCEISWWRPGHSGGWRPSSVLADADGSFAIPLPVAGERISLVALYREESYAYAGGVPVPAEGIDLVLRPLRPVALRLESRDGAELSGGDPDLCLLEPSGRPVRLGMFLDLEPPVLPVPEQPFHLHLWPQGASPFTAGPFHVRQLGGELVIQVPAPPEGSAPSAPSVPGGSPALAEENLPLDSPVPRDRALALAASGWLPDHLRSLATPDWREATRGEEPTAFQLEGRWLLGGERWVYEAVARNQLMCAFGAVALPSGWFAGLAPVGQPLDSTRWTAVDLDGRFTLYAPGPGRYRLVVSAQIDPMSDLGHTEARLLALDVVEIGGGEPTVWERDQPVGGLFVRTDERPRGVGSSRVLAWTGVEGVSGILGVDRRDDRLEYRIPCVPAGPAEVVEVAQDGSFRVLARVVVPAGGTVEVDLR